MNVPSQAEDILGQGYKVGVAQNSYKMMAALLILHKALEAGDRVLIFRYWQCCGWMYATHSMRCN